MKITKVTENGITYEVVEYSGGTKVWYLNGQRHRVDGPACEWTDGSKYWYLNDVEITQDNLNQFPELLQRQYLKYQLSI